MNIPEGWKLVPVKETHEMRAAFREAEKGALLSGHDHIEAFFCGYKAMLAAAPTPPAQEEPVAWYWQGQAPRVSVEKPYNVWRQEWIPLYTRPDNSGLSQYATRLEGERDALKKELREELDALGWQVDNRHQRVAELENENAALMAKNERLRKDAERWGFCRDNKNFRYFRNSGVWEILGQDRCALIEGRATTYQDAVDAAIAAMKEIK